MGILVSVNQFRKCASGTAICLFQWQAKDSVTAIWIMYCVNCYLFSLPNCFIYHCMFTSFLQGFLSCVHRKHSSTPCPDKPIPTEQHPTFYGFTSKAGGQSFLYLLEVPCFLSALIFTVRNQGFIFDVFQEQRTLFKRFEGLPAPLSFTWFRI